MFEKHIKMSRNFFFFSYLTSIIYHEWFLVSMTTNDPHFPYFEKSSVRRTESFHYFAITVTPPQKQDHHKKSKQTSWDLCQQTAGRPVCAPWRAGCPVAPVWTPGCGLVCPWSPPVAGTWLHTSPSGPARRLQPPAPETISSLKQRQQAHSQ